MTTEFYKLMLVTHRQEQPLADYLQFIKTCIASGVTSVQLREKGATRAFLLDYACQLKTLLDQFHIPLIINDNVELALEIDAHGVHLGQSDGSPLVARRRLGANKWIGLSIETGQELVEANACEVNYVAASAVFPTNNKANICKVWSAAGLSALAKNSVHPVVAIGGVNQHNIQEVMTAGAKGVAVIAALHDAANPSEMAAHLRELVEGC